MTRHCTDDWKLQFKANDSAALKTSFLNNLEYRLAKDCHSATRYDKYLSIAYATMERVIERWMSTQDLYRRTRPKRVYYLSMEWLIGRSLGNCLINLGLYEAAQAALADLDVDLEQTLGVEADAGLGNGGLGRLAACFMDSLATLGYPVHGYGLRYEFGLFHQKIVEGRQVEMPDKWLLLPNPWEIVRPEYVLPVRFGGRLEGYTGPDGRLHSRWVDAEEEHAMPYDLPIPGFRTMTVNTLRLWSARSTDEFNLDYFNHGDYQRACEEQLEAENLTRVLYPNDAVFEGRALRLKQEYFLVAASVHDIVLRFYQEWGQWRLLPEKVAIQLNDTHPALAIPELMRILVDEHGLDWETAWELTVRTFAYTNHTVLPEALEEWPVAMLESLLPRHLEIIYRINHFFLMDVSRRYPGDTHRLRRMSLIAEENGKRVRMAYLAVVGSHSVNGVSALHTRLLQETILRDFADFWPERFSNKTNGITPRRWLCQANPGVAGLITEAIGDGWTTDLEQLRRLEPLAEDPAFQAAWRAARVQCKETLITQIQRETHIALAPHYLFDVQVKRIHEYKRQLLFGFYITALYLRLKECPGAFRVPRACIFGGKAAPGYEKAKLIIHFLNNLADIINTDPDTQDRLRVLFLPNYRVSLAERIIPAADLSEQISLAGMEASGTGNMKFTLNGALTIGTLDGANVEISEEVGKENIFIFGMTADRVRALKENGYDPRTALARSPELQTIMRLLERDFFSPGEPGAFRPLYDELLTHDPYCLLADFPSYLACQDAVDTVYLDPARWTRMSILNVARSGKFSSDRTVSEYAREIWNAQPILTPPLTPTPAPTLPGEGEALIEV
jgi:starch phosphorylase